MEKRDKGSSNWLYNNKVIEDTTAKKWERERRSQQKHMICVKMTVSRDAFDHIVIEIKWISRMQNDDSFSILSHD